MGVSWHHHGAFLGEHHRTSSYTGPVETAMRGQHGPGGNSDLLCLPSLFILMLTQEVLGILQPLSKGKR